MTTDCKIYLPSTAHPQDVCSVIGRLIGLPAEMKKFSHGDGHFAEVLGAEGHSYQTGHNQTNTVYCQVSMTTYMFTIVVTDNPLDHEPHTCSWFWQDSQRPGMVVLIGGSNEFWKKVGKGLVDFFGGCVDYNDCDSVDLDHYKKTVKWNRSDNKSWAKLQKAIMNVSPIV